MNHYGIDSDAVIRLVMALALGALVGLERELTGQPAGLRTHIAVCLGACLFGVVSTLGFSEFEMVRTTTFRADVSRVASNVVVGVGFLGAGMIMKRPGGVANLTTARRRPASGPWPRWGWRPEWATSARPSSPPS